VFRRPLPVYERIPHRSNEKVFGVVFRDAAGIGNSIGRAAKPSTASWAFPMEVFAGLANGVSSELPVLSIPAA